jgi:predicted MPP superfamily phosphohydrolase
MYAKMPFGFMNEGATFQRAMYIYFADEKDKFIVIYLDDITAFSDSKNEHLKHLKRVFQKCRKFGISLNHKKSNFGMQEGKLLGRIISKEGIKIDTNRLVVILNIDTPMRKNEVQSFLGRVNFLRRFIPNG